MGQEYTQLLELVKLIDKILACIERVPNPTAHGGNPPLYEKEIQDALDLVTKMERSLI